MGTNNRNANIDYCGAVNLIRALVSNGDCTELEARRIAARIAVHYDANIILDI